MLSYTKIKIANQKFIIGDHITNKELDALLELYSRLHDDLLYLGEMHVLSWRECNRQRMRLEEMKKAREKK